MKKNIYILLVAIFACSCTDMWDDYYHGSSEGTEVTLDSTITEFFEENDEYSEFYTLLQTFGLDTIFEMDQQVTVWAVNNEKMALAEIEPDDTLRMEYHLNYLPFLRTDLKNGLRIPTLNGIYIQIAQRGEDKYVNTSKIESSYRLKNGVIHVIDGLMKSKINIFDFIGMLPDEYSIFRDSIFFQNEMLFDEEHSEPIGVDVTGLTEYDTVRIVHNPLFDLGVKFNSEFEQYTVFIPSNAVIEDCFKKLGDQYASMGQTLGVEDTIKAMQWIREAAFYDGILTDFSPVDLISSTGRVWRNSVQQVDQSVSIEMSNGLVYYSTDMKIPNNYILSRIKSYCEYYKFLSEEQIEDSLTYFNSENALKIGVSVDTGSKYPVPSIAASYSYLAVEPIDDFEGDFWVSFPPLEQYTEDGEDRARIMTVPVGEYDLYMGFRSSQHPRVHIYFNDERINGDKPLEVYDPTPWNYDRNKDTDKERNPETGIDKWDGLGGLVGAVVVKGENNDETMASFRIKVEFHSPEAIGGLQRLSPYHWALVPADSNY